MKITPKELKQIIKEEYQRALNEMDHLEQDMYPGDPYRVDALAAVDQLKELISDVDTDILEDEDILAAVQTLRNKLEYYMS